jgi:Uma2 family endonuclease
VAEGDRTMQSVPNRVKLTYADLLALPDDGLRHELIDGEHFVTPSPGSVHQLIAGNLYFLIRTYLVGHPIGVIMLAPFDIVLTDFDVVEPDLIYFSKPRFDEIVGERNARGAPDMAVEVLSPSTRRRDEITKRRLYERTGVREYWVVDPELETVKVYRVREGLLIKQPELSLEASDVLASPLLPDMRLPLSEMFRLP